MKIDKRTKIIKSQHITYKELLEIVSWGIFNMNYKGTSIGDKRLAKVKKEAAKNPILNAYCKGLYTGSPGRDIYFMLPYLTNMQMREIAILLNKNFPVSPQKSYTNVAVCIRFIYGQFEKQGVLKSDADLKEMRKNKVDWSLSRKVLKMLYEELEKNSNFYGLSILCEINGHRFGDESIINRDKVKLEEMENEYLNAINFARKCGGYKHLFSIYYWAYKYFRKFGETGKAFEYGRLAIIGAGKYYHKYFPNGEQYYSKRLKSCLEYVRENGTGQWNNFYKKYVKTIKSSSLNRKLR